jgi:exodeoxyribonuclease-3
LNQMPAELRVLPFETICWHAGQRPWYAGTAILTQATPQSHTSMFDHSIKFHEDGRVTQVEYDDYVLLNIYFPNGWTRADGTEMLSYKLWFYDDLTSYVQSLNKHTCMTLRCCLSQYCSTCISWSLTSMQT